MTKNKEDKWILRRYYFGYCLDKLDSAFDNIGKICEKRLYADLAHWKYMTPFSWESKKRELQKKEWESIKNKEIVDFDFAFDFDAPDFEHWEKAHKQCKKVVKYFDEHKIPYSVNWSGSKGFHIRISSKYIPEAKAIKKIENNIKLAKYLKAKFKLGTLDLQIYDMDRIFKLLYSIDGKTGLVVLPLDKNQFDNFYPSMCYPEIVLKRVYPLKNRGLLEREGDIKSVKALFKEVGI